MAALDREPPRQPALDGVKQHLEQIGGRTGQRTDQHGEQHHHLAGGEPPRKVEEIGVETFGAETHFS